METVVCDLCGAENPRHYLTTTDRFTGSAFNLYICNKCQLVYLSPRPTFTEIENLYPVNYEAYQSLGQTNSPVFSWHSRKALEKELKYIEHYRPERGRLLDLGCATGNFLLYAKDRGWKVFGIEIVEKAAQIARQQLRGEIITDSLDDPILTSGSMDVITLWDVLEHLPSPRVSLNKISDLLRPDGLVFFSIPNLDSYDRKLFKSEWIGWDAPRHFNLFSKTTILRLLSESGFEVLDRRCLLGGKGAFFLSLDRLIQKKKALKFITHFYPIISVILWPYRQFAYFRHKGPIIYYAVRKVKS